MTVDDIRSALSSVKYPGFSRDIVSFGIVREVRIEGEAVHVDLRIQTRDPNIPQQIFHECHHALDALVGGASNLKVNIDIQDPPGTPSAPAGTERESLPGVGKIIAVASGKGGVGKSTVAANLAAALKEQGLSVGLCDCDLYGPSVAHMFGAADQAPTADEHDNIVPIEACGIKTMSMGYLLGDGSPVIVRGPLANRYTQQFLRQVAWGKLDVLILDLPPGTGDIQLTIVQTIALDGAVIVTTPQEVALIDARKAATMFAKVNVPILGLIENMAWFECAHGERYHLFGDGGGVREAERLQVPLLGRIPIDPRTRERCDSGEPIAFLSPDESPASAAFHEAARALPVHGE